MTTSELVELLRKIEWNGERSYGYDGQTIEVCPCCGKLPHGLSKRLIREATSCKRGKEHFEVGHSADCDLARALREATQ